MEHIFGGTQLLFGVRDIHYKHLIKTDLVWFEFILSCVHAHFPAPVGFVGAA